MTDQEIQALRLRAETAEAAACRMREALTDLVDDDTTPEPACSCHLSPPCNDCVNHGWRRELIAVAKTALASTPPCPHAADTERMNKLEALVSGANLYYDILIQSDEDDGVWVSQRDTGLHGCIPLPNWETKSTTVREAIDAVVLRASGERRREMRFFADNSDLREALKRGSNMTDQERLVQSVKLQELTLNNQIRWMQKHDELLRLIDSLRDWKSPDGVLQVKDLKWFRDLAAQLAAAKGGK